MDRYIRGITLVSQVCGVFAAALLAASVVIVCQMVFVRYLLNETTIWQTDFVTWSLVAATFIGSPYLLLTRGHVNVDVLPLYLGPRARYWPESPRTRWCRSTRPPPRRSPWCWRAPGMQSAGPSRAEDRRPSPTHSPPACAPTAARSC